MAITTTPRFGLKLYGASSDAHPTRTEFNAMITSIENNGIVGSQGTAALRPAAGLGQRFYWATDASRMYWDNGAAWVEITNVGGGGAGVQIVVNGTAIEGSSVRAARADHTHNIPLATTSTDGAMVAADKAKLDGAVSAATASKLVIRDAGGRAQFATPSSTNDAANKGYVDSVFNGAAGTSHTHDAAAVITGEFLPARIPTVTSLAKGAMPNTDKVKLDAATSLPTVSTLAMRDAAGRMRAVDPANAADVATKNYVDLTVAGRTYADATQSVSGFMSIADKIKLDQATSAATASKLMVRDAAGRAKVATPAAADDIATKAYADGVGTGKRSDSPPFAHMGVTDGVQIVDTKNPKKTTMSAAQILKGGFTFDDANDALVVPVTGWYEIIVKGFMNSAETNLDGIFRSEAYVQSTQTGIVTAFTFHGDMGPNDFSGENDKLTATCTGLKYLTAGDKVQLFQRSTPPAGTWTGGSDGYDGAYIEVRWYAAS